MTPRILAAALAALVAFAPLPAMASGDGDWFRSLKQPGTGVSCCDVSDCHQTDSRWRDGGWEAWVVDRWQRIPPERVLSQVSIYEKAVVCHSAFLRASDGARWVYCFVPPLQGF